jgi:hypothetical protein
MTAFEWWALTGSDKSGMTHLHPLLPITADRGRFAAVPGENL